MDRNENAYTSGPTNPFRGVHHRQPGNIDLRDPPKPIPSPPANVALPTISGTAEAGQTLSASTGSWSESPSAYAYQWQRCDAQGGNCSAIPLATAQSCTVGQADVGSTLRGSVTATNAVGASAADSSATTAVVQQAAQTFGNTSVGAFSDSFWANRSG